MPLIGTSSWCRSYRPSVYDVLRHTAFRENGTLRTSRRTIPRSFSGVKLTDEEREELAAVSECLLEAGGWPCWISTATSRAAAAGEGEEELIVCLGGMFGEAYVVAAPDPEGSTVTVRPWSSEGDEAAEARELEIQMGGYDFTSPVVDLRVDGIEKAIQVKGE